MGLIRSLILAIILGSIFILSNVFAAPAIQIVSPQHISYATTKILVNVTSDEPTDFFYVTGVRDRKIQVLSSNSTSFITYLYAKNGNYSYTIYAGNSTSNISRSVAFRIVNVSNPINLTECGYIYSSDTHYFVGKNIGLGSNSCLVLLSTRNVSLDLNHYSTGQISVFDSSEFKLFNGSIYGDDYVNDVQAALYLNGPGVTAHLKDLFIFGGIGMFMQMQGGLLVENVTINATIGMQIGDLHHAEFRNVTMIFHDNPRFGGGYGIYDVSTYTEIIFNNLTLDDDFPVLLYFENFKGNYYLRNSPINFDKVIISDSSTTPYDNRIFIQHRVLLNVTDSEGNPLSSSIEVKDNSTFFTYSDDDIKYKYLLNPLLPRFIGTDMHGLAEIWLNEKLKYYQSGSPITLVDYGFYPYNLTARTGSLISSEIVNLTGRNSTFTANFTLNAPAALPICTVEEMFDLNGDGSVSMKDVLLLLRYLTGVQVMANENKNCQASSFIVP